MNISTREPIWRRYLRVFGPDPQADVDDELRFHMDELERRFLAAGMDAAEARRAAKAQFGDVEQARRAMRQRSTRMHRKAERVEWWRRAASDTRISVRRLVRRPTFTIAAILTLGLGMGATTSIYALLERVVLDPLHYPQAERLVRLENPVPGVGATSVWQLSTAQYFYFSQHARSLAEIGLFQRSAGILSPANGRPPQRVQAAIVTATMFDLLGARAEHGRILDRNDDKPGAPVVIVLSHAFWRREFGGSESIVGQTIQVNGQPMQVVGIMAPGVELPGEPGEGTGSASDLWVGFQLNPAGPFANNHVYPAIARLAPGATAASAQEELRRMLPELPRAFPTVYSPGFFKGTGFHTAVIPLQRYVVGNIARYLWIMFAAVGLVLAIACANVANLLLVRLEGRRREFAVRTALGAGWRDLAGDALREGLALSLTGGLLAVAIAYASVRWLVALAPPSLPRLENLRLDGHVFLFALLLGVVVAGLLAIVPVFQARAGGGVSMLGDGGRTTTEGMHRQRLRGALVVAQVALALVLVVSAGLLLRSFSRLRAVNPGVDPEGVLTVSVYLPPQRYDSLYKSWQFYSRALAQIRALPGVQSAGMSEEVPFEGGYGCTVQGFEDRTVYQHLHDANETTCAGQESTTPGYFRAMGIPLLEGRDFTSTDNDAPETGAVIVSKAFADRFWPGEHPIGQGVAPNGWSRPPFYHVVGVVGDVHALTVDDQPALAIYYPVVPQPHTGQWYSNGMVLVVRTASANPLSYLAVIRRVITQIDSSVPLANAEDMATIVARSMSQLTFTMTLLAIAGVTALLLAAVGLYGVISYVVALRTGEIGVRLALGAQPSQVEGLVVRDALWLTLIGLVVGTLAAVAFSRLLGGLLYGTTPWDPASYVSAVVVLVMVAALAGWVPARRAAQVDPASALRAE